MSIKISPKHGVNPCIPICFLCGEQKNEVALLGRLPADAEAPKSAILNMEPCDKCKEWQKQGIILISAHDDDEGQPNPRRTGGWVVVKEDALKRLLVPGPVLNEILRMRVAFIPDKVWDGLKMPRSS